MIPWILLGTATIPNNGGELVLSQRGAEFSIRLSGLRGELMNSRAHSSEDALARLACARLHAVDNARILVGGLGMGFTLAAALNATPASAQVTVAELIPAVVEWNHGALGDCAGRPLQDSRTHIYIGDVADLLNDNPQRFDAILLDVDNGPEAITHSKNNWIYSSAGLQKIYKTLRPDGMLALWSAGPNPAFSQLLKQARFDVSTKIVRAHAGKGSRHTIFLAQKTAKI